MAECIFCRVAAGLEPSWKVLETESAYAFLDIHPVSEYHTLVIPKRHYRDIFDTPQAELLALVATLKQVVDLYRERCGIQHVQIVNSSGAEAQQDVFHVHFHIVPRATGDGQDVVWSTRPEIVERFGTLIAALPGAEFRQP
jgi:histidine triad (HIT) family protein